MSALETVHRALEDRGCRPRHSGRGIKALCPGCQLDGNRHNPGLKVIPGDQRPVVLHCHGPGHCEADTILDALGLTWAELLGSGNQSQRSQKSSRRGQPVDLDSRVSAWQDALWRDADRLHFLRTNRGLADAVILAARLGFDGERYTIPIFDLGGEPLFVKKYLPGGSPKFTQEPAGTQAALYGHETLAPIEDGALVLVTAGELDCLLCRQHGYNAVSGTGGEKCWRDEWSALLARFELATVGDHDQDGVFMNRRAGDSLREAGAYVQALVWPAGTPPKTDPTDFMIRDGHSPDEFRALVEQARNRGRLRALDLARLLTEPLPPVPWAVRYWLAHGDVVALCGEGGSGKSAVTLDLATSLATGRPWLGSISVQGGPYRVLYIDEEMSETMIQHRLVRMVKAKQLEPAALAERIRYLSFNRLNLDDPERLQALWREVREFKPQFSIIDSLCRLHRREENSNSQMAQFLEQTVLELSRHFLVGVVLLHHMGKPFEKVGARYRIRGASAIADAVDTTWLLAGNGEGERTLQTDKRRWGAPVQTLSIQLEDAASTYRLIATEADVQAEEIVKDLLSGAGTVGALRVEVVSTLEDAGMSDPERTASRVLGRLYGQRSVKKLRDHRHMRYWMTAEAPEEAA